MDRRKHGAGCRCSHCSLKGEPPRKMITARVDAGTVEVLREYQRLHNVSAGVALDRMLMEWRWR